ncbi:MAG TPA: Rieske 2Fe-2S domain-containing protein [Egibacteraceae bacterium]|nr:Rieske 2Fe-2S domain-containing protein [Actinomycetota bacterium]HWB72168.1 Rieske 2Fe-2S domain-containing protein [Egibacteraceae bacterium]
MGVEALTARIEHSPALAAVGRSLGRRFASVVRPGTVKDLLSGTWLGHPLHPLLTDLTIGAWTSAAALDLFGGRQTQAAADALVGLGVASALPTAVTGLSDLSDVEDRQVRGIGAAHALGNTGALALYGLSYVARRRGQRPVATTLSVLGGAVMAAAGFLGGHLSYRKGLGVDRTAFLARLDEWTAVADDDALPEAKAQRVTVSGTDVLLYRHEGRIYALTNRCSHRGGPLDKGRIEDAQVTCPWHRSRFCLLDGSIVQGPATAPQPVYDVRVQAGKIEIRTRR